MPAELMTSFLVDHDGPSLGGLRIINPTSYVQYQWLTSKKGERNNGPVCDDVGSLTLGTVGAVLEFSDTFFATAFTLFW